MRQTQGKLKYAIVKKMLLEECRLAECPVLEFWATFWASSFIFVQLSLHCFSFSGVVAHPA